jgi:hypothetical protein
MPGTRQKAEREGGKMSLETAENAAIYEAACAAAVKEVRAIVNRAPGTFWNDARRIAQAILVCRGHGVYSLGVVNEAVGHVRYTSCQLLALGVWLGDLRNCDDVEYVAYREKGRAS